MSDFHWTLDHLRIAEEALERRRRAVDSGDADPGLILAEAGCERACKVCNLQCSVIACGIETTKRGLAEQARREGPQWELRHAGHSYAATAGRA